MNTLNAYKNFQRKYYDIISYKSYSSVILTLIILLVFLTFLNLGEVWLLWGRDRYESVVSSLTNNIAGKSFQNKLCQATPIDVVYTWVNGSDPKFLKDLHEAMTHIQDQSVYNDTTSSRFRDKEELRYSLRSLEKFAPWIRHVYIVTNGQIPYWLNLECPHVTLVTHREIFPFPEDLPTFSSPAIESHLHRIPGLSELFLYFNDDILLGKEIWPEDFFSVSKGFKIFFSWNIPDCSSDCPWSWVGDGSCDPPCDTERCAFDMGDCSKSDEKPDLYPKYVQGPVSGPIDMKEAEVDEEIKSVEKLYKQLKRNGSLHVNRRVLSKIMAIQLPKSNDTKFIQNFPIIEYDLGMHRSQLHPKSLQSISNRTNNFISTLRNRKMNLSEAVKLNNVKYLQRTKAQREMKKKKFKHRARLPSKESNPTRHAAFKIYPNQLQFLHPGELNYMNISLDEAYQSEINIKFVEKPDWQELNLTINRKEHQLDMFGESLLFVHKLYNKEFGIQIRKVPAHMPHLLSKEILERLQDRFPNEWRATSHHRFRHSTDMQLAFSYFHFLVSQSTNRTIDSIFEEFDTDQSGTWSDREIRTLLTRLYGTPLTLPAVLEFEAKVINCSKRMLNSDDDVTAAPYDRYIDSKLPTVSKKLVEQCSELVKVLHEEFPAQKLYRTEIVYDKQQDGVFKGLVNNLSLVLDTLDYIRANQKKFICLNDNIVPTEKKSQEEIIIAVLQDFYQSLYPHRSMFELPPGLRNRFLYVADYISWREYRSRMFTGLLFIFCGATAGCLYACCQVEVSGWLPEQFVPRLNLSPNLHLRCIVFTTHDITSGSLVMPGSFTSFNQKRSASV